MLYTSAEANKLLKKLNDEKASLENTEHISSTFTVATSENIEEVRPKYDYAETQAIIAEIEAKIRKIKHAINRFNLEQEVPGFNMTVDQVLVYMPQLATKKVKLERMKARIPKVREYLRVAGIIEYTYTNYDIEEVKRDYDNTVDELSRAQTALDLLNNSVKFEIDV